MDALHHYQDRGSHDVTERTEPVTVESTLVKAASIDGWVNHDEVHGHEDGLADGRLMASVKAGDTEAFGVLYQRYKVRMLNYFYRRVCELPMAEEMLQDLFISIFESASRFDTSRSFATWLFAIAANMCKDYFKHRQRAARGQARLRELADLASPDSGSEPSLESQVMRRLDASLVREAIRQLPPAEREVLVRHEYEGASYQDLANELECSVQTVRWRKHSAMKKLRDLLGPLLQEDANELR